MINEGKVVLKVVLCGEYGVGKSSLFRRFVHDAFVESTDRASTLGLDHFSKPYSVDGKTVQLQLWDTGGLERVASVTTSYFKHADGVLLVFGYDAFDSFNALSQHLIEAISSAENAKIFLCGNKLDLINSNNQSGPSEVDVETFWTENQISEGENMFRQMYKVSCKTKENVHEMFEDIAHILVRAAKPEKPNPDHFKVRSASTESSSKRKRCNGACSNT